MPKEYDAVPLTALETLPLALQNFIAHCGADGILGKIDIQGLTDFLVPLIANIGATPFIENTGSPLPNPVDKDSGITIVGAGTFDQTTGSDIVTTEPINFLFWDGTSWSVGVEVPVNLSEYALKSYVDSSLGNVSELSGGGVAVSANLSATYNFVSNKVHVPAGSTFKSVTFPYNTTTPFSILIFSLSGVPGTGTWTVIDRIPVTPVIGTNVVAIDKIYPQDAYFGVSKGSTMYYTSGSGPDRINRLGTATLDVGNSLLEDGGALGVMNFTLQYVSSLINVNDLKSEVEANTEKLGGLVGLDVSAGGTTTSSTLNNTLNFVTTEELVPAGKLITNVKFPYPSTTPFSLLIISKSESIYTVVDKISVTPVVGMNTVEINKTYDVAVHFGSSKPGTLYYTPNPVGAGRIVTLGSGTLNIGSTVSESGGVSGKINLTVNYFDEVSDLVELVNSLVPNPSNEILVSNKVWLINGHPIPIYKSSLIRSNRDLVNQFSLVQSALVLNSFEMPKYEAFIEDKTLDAAEIVSSPVYIFSKDYNDTARDFRAGLEVIKADADAKSGQSVSLNALGDSLTNRGVVDYTIKYLSYIGSGLTVIPMGTMLSSTTGGLTARNNEGREGWMYANFIGASNRQMFTNTPITRLPDGATSSTLYQNPFLRLALSNDKTNHPTWCFRNTGSEFELSYEADTDKTGDFYIFDYGYYVVQHLGGVFPSVVSIALSTNDITRYGATGVANSLFALEVMLTSINLQAPGTRILIIPATVQGDNSTTWTYVCDFINQSKELVADLGFGNIDFLGVWMHQNRHFIFPYSGTGNNTPIQSDGNTTYQLVKSEYIHFNVNGYHPYAKALAGYLIGH